jgi:hypothetical protein
MGICGFFTGARPAPLVFAFGDPDAYPAACQHVELVQFPQNWAGQTMTALLDKTTQGS